MSDNINVVFMGNFLYPHGMAGTKRIQHFIDYLTHNSVSVKVLLLRQGGARPEEVNLDGTHKGILFKTIGNDIKLNLALLITIPIYFLKGFSMLRAWRNKKSKNILCCYGGLNIENIMFVFAARMMGYYVVLDIVEDFSCTQERRHLLSRIKLFVSAPLRMLTAYLANGIIVISSYLMDLQSNRSHGKVPIVLIPISAVINPAGTKQEFSNPIKIVYAGTFAQKDGVELLIEAFERLSAERTDCILLLAGKGLGLSQIKKRIDDNKHIQYVGYLNDEQFYQFLNEADIMCITRVGSKFANAGFPFKLGEYLATGNPVIVTKVSDVSLYLENMKDAIIVDADNVVQIQKALEYCVNNPKESRKIGENGRRKCGKYFNPNTNGQYLLKLFRDVK